MKLNLNALDMGVTVSRLNPGHADRPKGVYFASWQDVAGYGDTMPDALRALAANLDASHAAEVARLNEEEVPV